MTVRLWSTWRMGGTETASRDGAGIGSNNGNVERSRRAVERSQERSRCCFPGPPHLSNVPVAAQCPCRGAPVLCPRLPLCVPASPCPQAVSPSPGPPHLSYVPSRSIRGHTPSEYPGTQPSTRGSPGTVSGDRTVSGDTPHPSSDGWSKHLPSTPSKSRPTGNLQQLSEPGCLDSAIAARWQIRDRTSRREAEDCPSDSVDCL